MKHPMFLTRRLDGDLSDLPVHPSGVPMFSTAVSCRTGELLYVDTTGTLRYGVNGFEFRPSYLRPPPDRSLLVVAAGGTSPLAVSVDSIVAATFSDIPVDYSTDYMAVCSVLREDTAPHPAWGLSFAPRVFYPPSKRLKPTYDYAEPIPGEIWADLDRLDIIVSSHNRFKYKNDMEHCVTVPRTEYARVRVKNQDVFYHRLVCEAFYGPGIGEQDQVDHRDGNAANNHPHNLAWASSTENNNNRIMSGSKKAFAVTGHRHWQMAIVPVPISRLNKCAQV